MENESEDAFGFELNEQDQGDKLIRPRSHFHPPPDVECPLIPYFGENIEIALAAILASSVVIDMLSGEVAAQVKAAITDRRSEIVFDLSKLITFATIAWAAFQIPVRFSREIVMSCREIIEVMSLCGATDRYIAVAVWVPIRHAIAGAIWKGIVMSGLAYIALAELFQIVSVTSKTGFLWDVGVASIAAILFALMTRLYVFYFVYRILGSRN